MINLLKETRNHLENDGYRWPEDILSVQNLDGTLRISPARFEELADRQYDNGFGGVEVATDLVVVMKDGGWYARRSYDGAEFWHRMKTPVVPDRIDDGKVLRVMVETGRLRSPYLCSDLGTLQYDRERALAVVDFWAKYDDRGQPVVECVAGLAEAVALRQEFSMGNPLGANAVMGLSADELVAKYDSMPGDDPAAGLYDHLMDLAEKHRKESDNGREEA